MLHYCLFKYSSQLLIRIDNSQCGPANSYTNFWGTAYFKLKGQCYRRNIFAPIFLTWLLF